MVFQLKKVIDMKKAIAGLGAMGAMGLANAAAIDVASVVTDIEAQAGPVALIGAAVLVLVVGVKAFKWVRSALG